MRPSVETDKLAVPKRNSLADDLTLYTCLKNCYGKRDMAASCCTITERDYIIGPIPDAEELLERLSAKYERKFSWAEVFIDFEEGRSLFPDRPTWQKQTSYPALRLDLNETALPCRFLGKDNLCTIHDVRSVTCSNYFCKHLKTIIDCL